MNLITQLPELNSYNAICVIVDRLTKRAHFISINNQFSSKDMAQLLYDKVYPLHGLPLQIILDRCYETPKEERTSRTFRNLIDNIKLHNRVKL